MESLAFDTWKFIFRKIKSFFPYMLFGYIIALLAKTHLQGTSILKNSVGAINEILLLKSSALYNVSFDGPIWYLSAMILSMIVIYPLIRRYKRNFTMIAAPVISVFILGYLIYKFGHLRNPETMCTFFNKGFLRGFAEICLGCFCYEVAEKMKNVRLTRLGQTICTGIEYCFLIGIIWHSNTPSCWGMDSAIIIWMAICVIIIGSNQSLLSGFWSTQKITPYLGKFSLMIYLNHIYWVWIFDILNIQMEYFDMFWCYVLCSVFSAVVCWITVDKLITIFQRNNMIEVFIRK